MTKRGQRIYDELVSMTENLSSQELMQMGGILTSDLADRLDIQRSNVSMELNKMVRAGTVGKIKAFPVRYIPVKVVEDKFDLQWNTPPFEIKSLHELSVSDEASGFPEKDPFQRLIGADGRLKQAIAQAKAALLYPPHGLPTLFIGNHGSGKETFARTMHQCISIEKGTPVPFVHFACNEYSTGERQWNALCGTVDESGFLKKAHRGVLYISEIHQLEAPAREAFFSFLSTGMFWEDRNEIKKSYADVLVIGSSSASTTLLTPFLNTFTMTIKLPAFSEGSLQEQIDLCLHFFQLEAKRIQKKLDIHADVVNALLDATEYGGLSELHSNIQMTCAHAFLHTEPDADVMMIQVQDLPLELARKWSSSREQIRKRTDLVPYLEMHTMVFPTKEPVFLEESETFDVYQVIEEKMNFLREEGLEETTINQYILTDLRVQLRTHYRQNKDLYGQLEKFVDPEIIRLVENFRPQAEKKLKTSFGHKFVYFVSMHLEAYQKRENSSDSLPQKKLLDIQKNHSKEYALAQTLSKEIKKTLQITLPETEIAYLAVLFLSIEELDEKKQIGLVVLAHGESTASSMLEVAVQLFGEGPVAALDMPLSAPLSEMMKPIKQKVKEVENGKGVLLLVDMGSLESLEETLSHEMDIPIRTLSNVTTAMVLEAVRKLSYSDYHLDTLYDSLYQDFFTAPKNTPRLSQKKKAILCICMSGSGTAKKLHSMVQELVYQEGHESIAVLTVSALKLKETIPKLEEEYQIIATVGTKNPHISAPYISLERLIDGEGEKEVISAIHGRFISSKGEPSGKKIVVYDLCIDTLKRHLIYLNPCIITDILLDWARQLEKNMKKSFSNTFLIRFIVHTAFSFERCLRGESLAYGEEISPKMSELLPIINQTLQPYEEKLSINISKDEKWYLVNMLEEL